MERAEARERAGTKRRTTAGAGRAPAPRTRADHVLALQRSAGNAAVSRAVIQRAMPPGQADTHGMYTARGGTRKEPYFGT